ncbi:MAG: DUF4397 domain-containing protein [Candidatus Competibacterales bacterium]
MKAIAHRLLLVFLTLGTLGPALGIAQSQDTEATIQNLYRSLLGRPADPTGLAFWANELDAGHALDAIAQAFLASGEYTQGSLPRAEVYFAALDRTPTADELLALGDQAQTGADLPTLIGDNLLTNPAFLRRFGQDLSDQAFVEANYQQILGRDADPAGLAFWLDELTHGLDRGAIVVAFTLEALARGLLDSETVTTAMAFQALAGRQPGADELVTAATLGLEATLAGLATGSLGQSGLVRVLHASPDAPAVDVLLDDTLILAGVDFKQGSGYLPLAPGNYALQVDGLLPQGPVPVIGPAPLEIAVDTVYSVVAVNSVAVIEPVIIANPGAVLSPGELRVQVLHAAPSAPEVDVFVTTPGISLDGIPPLGTFAFRGTLGPVTLPAGDYQIRVTLAGDPTVVVLDSGTLPLASGDDLLVSAVDNTAPGATPIGLVVQDAGGSAQVLDAATPAELRVIHNSPDAPAVDIVVDEEVGQPLVAGLSYTESTEFLPLPPADYQLQITVADDPTAVALDFTATLEAGRRYSAYAVDFLADIAPLLLVDDRRSVATQARLRLVHGSPSAGPVDIYLTPPGTPLTAVTPLLSGVTFTEDTGYLDLVAGDYELVLTPTGSITPALGPLAVSLLDGGVYTAIARDAPGGGNPLAAILLDDFD